MHRRSAFRLTSTLGISALLSLAVINVTRADESIRVLMPTPLAVNNDVPAKVKEECHDLGRVLPLSIARGNRNVVLVNSAKELTARTGRYFLLEIVEIKARGGGVWSGPKHMLVRGIAFADGKQVADVEAERGSTMAFSACSSLEKVERVLGQDLAKWLISPKPHDHL